ncbi:hypothetical protein RGL42_004935 [Vibrio parahaemolyticus]|nr:hypothetical protein [Vibrio parahaemolyticus]
MKVFLENYEVILLPAALGLFVYFTHGTPAFYAVIPLFVLISVNANQARKLKRLEIQVSEMKAKLNDVK